MKHRTTIVRIFSSVSFIVFILVFFVVFFVVFALVGPKTTTYAGVGISTQQAPTLPVVSDSTILPSDATPTPHITPFSNEKATSEVLPAIVGGEEAPEDAYPWVTAIIRSNATNEQDGWICGGSLIRPGWVLTAAHCADDAFYRPLPPSAIDVLIGRHRLSDSDGERIDVVEVIFHPNYNGATFDYDIALLRLSQNSTLSPIELVPIDDILLSAPGVLSTIVGWGDTLENGPGSYSDVLRQVQVPVVSNDICNAPASYNGKVTSRMLCAGFAEGGKDACHGDSGGPLMVPNPQGGWLQAGITSWGIGCAEPNLYGVYTRIGTLGEWIQSKIGTPEPTPTPAPNATPTPSAVTPNPTPTATPNYARKMIRSLRTSNVRDSVFSVSWTTENALNGALYVAGSPSELANTPRVFNSPATGQSHFATATGLAAQTTYYFYVRSGDHIDDNLGSYYRVTTGRTLVLPNSDNVRGFIEDSNGLPATGCTVLAEIVNRDPVGSPGISALLATRSDETGFWTLDLGNTRTATLDGYFLYSLSGDRLSLEVQCAPNLAAGVALDTNNDAPAPTITVVSLQRVARALNTGWNLVALPVQPVGRFSAERLCAQMKQDATTGLPVEVVRWHNNQWTGHICGVNANNFDLQSDTAYFIRHNGPGVIDLGGLPLSPAAEASTMLGWNGVNGAYWNAANASSLCESISLPQQSVEVNRWFAAGWDGHICTEGFNNFAVVQGDGYFVKTQNAPTFATAAETDQPTRSPSTLAQQTVPPNNALVSNLTDGSAVLSWWTDAPANSWLEISRNGQIVAVIDDVRGAQTVDTLHYVQVTGLAPETSYQFTLFSNYVDDGFDSRSGTFTTLKTPNTIPQSHSAYGRIWQTAGRSPSTAMQVKLTLINADDAGTVDKSLPLTGLLDGNGYWYVNLGNARTPSGDIYTFGVEDIVEIIIKSAASTVTKTVTVAQTFPAPDIEITTRNLYMPNVLSNPDAKE
ncbi:trypsin-like serine protease [bacterium]|nr:trypsin-like serine protease [bacterium]